MDRKKYYLEIIIKLSIFLVIGAIKYPFLEFVYWLIGGVVGLLIFKMFKLLAIDFNKLRFIAFALPLITLYLVTSAYNLIAIAAVLVFNMCLVKLNKADWLYSVALAISLLWIFI